MLNVRWKLHLPQTPVVNPQDGPEVWQSALFAGFRECLFLAEADVKPRTPVITGRLRAGWQTAVTLVRGTPVRFHGVLQDPVPYAIPVEERRHMLRDTEAAITPKVFALMQQALSAAKKRLGG